MNERERVLDLVKKVCFLQKKHWICWKEWQKPKTRIKSTKLQLKYPLIRQIMTFEEVEEREKKLLMVKKNFVKMKQDKENLEKSWTDWQLRQTKLLLN